MIDAIGLDIVDIRRIKAAMERWGEGFTQRIFTRGELAYCMSKRSPEVHLAARFAAKEAFLKAVGLRAGIKRFKDIDVVRRPDGSPKLEVSGFSSSNKSLYLTISHDGDYCVAQVVVEGKV